MDPCELRQADGDKAVRDLVARRQPLFAFAIAPMLAEHDLDTAEGRVAALQRTVPLVARIRGEDLRDGYARRLAGWTGCRTRTPWSAGCAERRGRTPAGPRRSRPATRPGPECPSGDPRLRVQREVIKAALQAPALAGPGLRHAARRRVQPPRLPRGPPGGARRRGHGVRALRPQLAERGGRRGPHRLPPAGLRAGGRGAAVAGVRRPPLHRGELAGLQESLVGKQVAEIKSRLQRLSPVTDADEYHELFGDLVPLEQYRNALRGQAAGVSGADGVRVAARRLLTGREPVPEGFTGTLDQDERVLADGLGPRGTSCSPPTSDSGRRPRRRGRARDASTGTSSRRRPGRAARSRSSRPARSRCSRAASSCSPTARPAACRS